MGRLVIYVNLKYITGKFKRILVFTAVNILKSSICNFHVQVHGKRMISAGVSLSLCVWLRENSHSHTAGTIQWDAIKISNDALHFSVHIRVLPWGTAALVAGCQAFWLVKDPCCRSRSCTLLQQRSLARALTRGSERQETGAVNIWQIHANNHIRGQHL